MTECLLFVPLLIYGIAHPRPVAEGKRFFAVANGRLPFAVTILVATKASIGNGYPFLATCTTAPGFDQAM
ncbi:MAG: hypothetical protein NXI30_09515 [bacterium]|nr:hypothetical protein [bacterium]